MFRSIWFKILLGSLAIGLAGYSITEVNSQDDLVIDYPPNQDYGQQGDFIVKTATDAGRSAIISTIGPAVLLLPESPGSSDAHVTLQNWDSSWNLADPMNPEFVRYVNCYEGVCRNGQGQHAHATKTVFDDGKAYLWTNNYWQMGNSHVYDPVTGDTYAESPFWQISSGRLYTPFIISDFWSYGAPFEDDATLYYSLEPGNDWRGQEVATWDHLGDTGVTGFFSFIGDLMIVSADQASTGIAIYRINGWRDSLDTGSFTPELLSVYQPTLTEPDGNQIGIGGYWAEPYGANKMVWAARSTSAHGRNYGAMYVVDFTDPTDPQLTCELYFNQDTSDPFDGDNMTMPMYVNFQDQYAYVDHMKVDIDLCESTYQAGKALDPDYIISGADMAPIVYRFATSHNFCDGSQYFRPLGQIGVFGGMDRYGSESIITFTGPPIEEGSYSSGTYAAYNFSDNQILSGSTNYQIGDTLGSGRIITNVEIDERMNYQGICFFVTSDEADTNPPYISGHRPLANESNVAVDTFISFHIPETVRTETMVNAIQLTRLDNGQAVPFTHRLTHTGSVTLWPDENLPLDVDYQVSISGIQDYMGNTMAPYSFTFSTGETVSNPQPTATATTMPTAVPTTDGTTTPMPTVEATVTPMPTAEATPAPPEQANEDVFLPLIFRDGVPVSSGQAVLLFDPPSQVTPTLIGNELTLSWEGCESAASFRVLYGRTGERPAAVTTSNRTVTFTGLSEPGSVSLLVECTDWAGNTIYSDPVNVEVR